MQYLSLYTWLCQYVWLNGHSELYCIDDKMVMTSFSYLNREKSIIVFKILSAFQVKVLNFGGSISKGFLKHQISREKVLWEVDNNNPNSFSPRKIVGEDILMRRFLCGWVSTCESEWVRDSVTLSLKTWYRLIFLSDHVQTSYISPPSCEEESYWFLVRVKGKGYLWHFVCETLWVWYQLQFCAQSFRNCTSFSWREDGSYWYGATGFEAKVNHGNLPKNRCGYDAGYRIMSDQFESSYTCCQ